MLQALGVDNYGINSVVGGIVGMSSLITSTMSQAIGRYITCALGRGDKEKLRVMFSTSISAQIVLSVTAVVALEIAGVWFLNNVANIPEGRMVAANWVLQCSIITLVFGLISSPYGALILAHERMTIYAYMTIVDVAIRLVICFIISAYGGDRLILLAILQVFVSLSMRLFYGWYCARHFDEAHYSPRVFDKSLLKELTVFSGWNLLNNGAWVFATQGVNMLINVFFGVAFNGARSIANSVNSAIQSFVGNFTVAFSPQITKSYSSGDVTYSMRLANRGTKFSWLLMYLFIVPVFMEAEMLLQLWLGQVPPMATLFLRFAMFESLAVTSGQNLFQLIQADGHVKQYTIRAAIVAGLIFPVAWVAYYLGAPVWVANAVFIVDFLCLNLVRFYILKKLMPFSVRQHLRECILPCVVVSITSFILPVVVSGMMHPGMLRFFVVCAVSVTWTAACAVVFGLTRHERQFMWSKAMMMYHKYLRRS